MAVYSPLRYRRFSKERAEKTYQYIGFRLRDRWFGLPIEAMEKATLMGKVESNPQNPHLKFAKYEGQEILVVNVDSQIFGDVSSVPFHKEQVQFLAVVKDKNGNLLGLPIDSPPSVLRIPESTFVPLLETCPDAVNIQCLTSKVARIRDREPLLLLDTSLLFHNVI